MASFLRGFVWAGRGIATAVKQERNLRFHLCVAVYVYLFSFFYSFSVLHYVAITILVGGVLALELVNSSIERVVDRLTTQQDPLAAAAKDMAAGAVLVFSIAAAVCGILLYWNLEAFARMLAFFTGKPLWLIPLAASLAACYLFVFRYNRKEKTIG